MLFKSDTLIGDWVLVYFLSLINLNPLPWVTLSGTISVNFQVWLDISVLLSSYSWTSSVGYYCEFKIFMGIIELSI